MKKIILLLLISFSVRSQVTKIKIKQLENPGTFSLNLAANSLSVGIIKQSEVAVSSPSDGWLWHGQAHNTFVAYHSDYTGATYNWEWANATRSVAVYMPATAQATTSYGVQFTTSDATGLAFSPNGNIVIGANTTSCVISNSLSLGKTTTPQARLDVNGGAKFSGTVTVGNTSTLTGGNSGTIAVLSDAVFAITFNPINFNIADAGTYYFGSLNYPPQTFAATMGTVALPYNCKLVAWTFDYYLGGTTGTSETSTLYVRKNNTTDYTLSNAITFSSATATGFSGTGLTESYAAGDRINAKLLAGTFVTNPTQAYFGLTLFFVRE